jgi:hypothetical protein
MSDTSQSTGADGIPEGSGTPAQGEIREEVRLDLDEESIEKWDAVRDDYAVDTDADVSRPALSESEDDDDNDLPLTSEDDEEDSEAEADEGDLVDGGSDEEE